MENLCEREPSGNQRAFVFDGKKILKNIDAKIRVHESKLNESVVQKRVYWCQRRLSTDSIDTNTFFLEFLLRENSAHSFTGVQILKN